jgi:hypothetical protein
MFISKTLDTSNIIILGEVKDGFKSLFDNPIFAEVYRQRNGSFMPDINSQAKPELKREMIEM